MTTTISGSCFIQVQATMLHLCLGLVLAGLAVKTHAAQPEPDLSAPQLEIVSIQLAHYDTMQPVPYRFSAGAGLSNIASGRAGFGGTSSLPDFINLKKVTSWVASIRWHLASEGDRASLSPNLRIESKETLLVIRPIQQSVWMTWRKPLD